MQPTSSNTLDSLGIAVVSLDWRFDAIALSIDPGHFSLTQQGFTEIGRRVCGLGARIPGWLSA